MTLQFHTPVIYVSDKAVLGCLGPAAILGLRCGTRGKVNMVGHRTTLPLPCSHSHESFLVDNTQRYYFKASVKKLFFLYFV